MASARKAGQRVLRRLIRQGLAQVQLQDPPLGDVGGGPTALAAIEISNAGTPTVKITSPANTPAAVDLTLAGPPDYACYRR